METGSSFVNMSDFERFKEGITRTDGEPLTDWELEQLYYPSQYVRASSGQTPEQLAAFRRKVKRKMAWLALREKIARLIFRF